LPERATIQFGLGFESPPFHSWGGKAFDGLEGSGINANNIVSFQRAAVAA
jgi:hypothetical protein